MLTRLFNKIFKRNVDTSQEDGYPYIGDDGWYVTKPKGWKVAMKMSPCGNVFRVDMKSLHKHVFGGEYENTNHNS